MNVRFFDRENKENPLNGRNITAEIELSQILDRLHNRQPFFCELLGENGYKLLVGIGPTMGCVQHSPEDGSPPYLMALPSASNAPGDDVIFLIGGTATPVPLRYCLPFEAVQKIVTHFQRTGERFSEFAWEEI
jgi:hypothetical protein